ncbi:hypothetical protein IWQ60_010932 [Tieghemiomyces parasiticus]|uniref:EF hand associated type-2 domain-containing protein n=1 Tax=Tieghemiomyces parasiticus TaxID=78921 RepID=A0A9W8DJ05_9FUNG|nr:hypothetical protein IWQ60_010932 [Tieghemiomyces parasiticus]
MTAPTSPAATPATTVPLLDEDGDLTPEFDRALVEIFGRYAKTNPESLDEAELRAYSTFCNGTPFSDDDLEDILGNLDSTEDGKRLTVAGFVQLYHLQTAGGDEEETWRDLRKHGYDSQLRLVSAADSTETKPDPSTDADAAPAESSTA